MTNNGTRWTLLGVTAVTAVGVGRAVARRRRRHQPDRQNGWYVVRRAVTVDRPRDAVIGFWTDRERLDHALAEWATLEQLDERRWRCVARDRNGGDAEWRAEITVDGPGALRWQVEDGPVPQHGRVELTEAPQGRGTEIRAELRYRSGPLRRMFGLASGHEPDLALRDTLRRVKALVECGQVIDTRRDPSGRSAAQERATDRMREKLMTGGRA
ncbi:putative membrane protein [Micromonospora profundi]|uniref:SRPBCC family protein n=1 Tax=Micromonospora profundi TaxID=1420889 RepID=UPI00143902F3|nr:cyclase [Micromonospora profundi]NJC10589.1 putative membrane protein [Micromonospora profundi]